MSGKKNQSVCSSCNEDIQDFFHGGLLGHPVLCQRKTKLSSLTLKCFFIKGAFFYKKWKKYTIKQNKK